MSLFSKDFLSLIVQGYACECRKGQSQVESLRFLLSSFSTAAAARKPAIFDHEAGSDADLSHRRKAVKRNCVSKRPWL